MNKMISEKLKKRTFIDTVLSCILCLTALVFAVIQFVCYLENTSTTEHLTNSLCSFVIFAELGLLALILLEIHKTGKPFSKRIIAKLRIMAVMLFAIGLIPSQQVISSSEADYSVMIFDMHNLLLVALGVIIGIISEIFVYGLSLQEDNDLIA